MLIDLQRALVRALTSADPIAALRRARLSQADRALLRHADDDGVRLTGLIVQKLRFERICRGDDRMEAWFERDGKSFVQAFKRYNKEVPPREFFPRAEAGAFWQWCRANGFAGEPGRADDV